MSSVSSPHSSATVSLVCFNFLSIIKTVAHETKSTKEWRNACFDSDVTRSVVAKKSCEYLSYF